MQKANLHLEEVVKFRAPLGFGSAIARLAAKGNLSASALMRQTLTEKLRSAGALTEPAEDSGCARRLATALARAAGDAR